MSKKKNNFKGNRILKDNSIEIKPGEFELNPLTLMITKNTTKKNIYFSKFHFNNDKLSTTTFDKKIKLSNNEFMPTPSILIQSNDFLKIYDIYNINDLIDYINNNIDNIFNSNNRIINCFIRSNYKDLSKNNKILSNIYLKLFKNYKINIEELYSFINSWFKNNNPKSFYLDLGNDLQNYLTKNIYES